MKGKPVRNDENEGSYSWSTFSTSTLGNAVWQQRLGSAGHAGLRVGHACLPGRRGRRALLTEKAAERLLCRVYLQERRPRRQDPAPAVAGPMHGSTATPTCPMRPATAPSTALAAAAVCYVAAVSMRDAATAHRPSSPARCATRLWLTICRLDLQAADVVARIRHVDDADLDPAATTRPVPACPRGPHRLHPGPRLSGKGAAPTHGPAQRGLPLAPDHALARPRPPPWPSAVPPPTPRSSAAPGPSSSSGTGATRAVTTMAVWLTAA